MKNKTKGWLFFGVVFATVCVFRVWYGIFLIFAYALIETALRKKRSFCYDTCPIGNLLDFAGGNSPGRLKKYSKKANFAGWVFFSVYVAFIIFVLVVFAGNGGDKWYNFFRLMAGSVLLALLADIVFGKRFWCIYMCPLSRLMKLVLNFVRR
ncbi:MAG TPA: 4Fe-4S binding protein [Clostridia bacterium]|nr:4Fe-4S binding protein [Clostridia bacterium]